MEDEAVVCDNCGEYSCLAGIMYCEEYKTAGTCTIKEFKEKESVTG